MKGKNKVLEICRLLKASEYFNAIGGLTLYSKEDFARVGVSLRFVQTETIEYNQRRNCLYQSVDFGCDDV